MAESGALRQLIAEFFFKVDGKELEKGKKQVGDFMGDIKKVAAAFAGGAIAAGIKSFVHDTVEEITAVRRGAAELSITTDEFQALRSAGRALGIDIKWLHFSMERLMVSTELAARGSARQATSMKLAGLEVKKANGEHKSAAELFLDLAGGLEKIQDPAKRAIIVWDLFGRGGHRLLPMLTVGKERLQLLMETTKKYGQYSAETIKLAAQFSVSTETLNAAYTGLKDTIMKSVLPALERGVIRTREWVVWFNELAKRSMIGRAALYALSAVMAGIAAQMALAYPMVFLVAAAFAALTLALDDLLVWWNGGQSIIGDLLDKIGGKGTSAAAIEAIRQAWQGIKDILKEIGSFIEEHPDLIAALTFLPRTAWKAYGIGAKGVAMGAHGVGTAIGWAGGKWIEHKADELRVPSWEERNSQPTGEPLVGPSQTYNRALGWGVKSMPAVGKRSDTYNVHTTINFTGTVIDKAAVDHAMEAARQEEYKAAAAARARRAK